MQKSYTAKPSNIQKIWYEVDAEDKILGRLASKIAVVLMGKHRATYTPHMDTGDFVIVTNAGKVKVTGKKEEEKKYYSWSGYPGGLKIQNLKEKRKRKPEEIVYLAVRRMLPKSKMGKHMLKKLKVYNGTEHPHQAQNPKALK